MRAKSGYDARVDACARVRAISALALQGADTAPPGAREAPADPRVFGARPADNIAQQSAAPRSNVTALSRTAYPVREPHARVPVVPRHGRAGEYRIEVDEKRERSGQNSPKPMRANCSCSAVPCARSQNHLSVIVSASRMTASFGKK